jgi:TonB dependent receptor
MERVLDRVLVRRPKFEHDPYTGGEWLPSARFSWKATDSDLLWLAISRAVRAPSRIDRDLFQVLGPIVIIRGGNFQPEKVVAYEAGYRTQPTAESTTMSRQNACETPAKYPRRGPNCGAPTPMPVPSRISYFLSSKLMTSNRADNPLRPCRSKSWLTPRFTCV